jgi:hypothetical protein
MNEKLFFRQRLIFTIIVSIAIWLLLIFDHFNGGVPSHHLLNKKDLPEISNWWGGLLLPLLTWFLLYRLNQRFKKNNESSLPRAVYFGFFATLIFGIVLSVFFSFGYLKPPEIMMEGVLLVALFYPIYRAECILGFVLGMIFTFGTVLPTGIGLILVLIGAILYLYVRPIILFIISKFTRNLSK